MIIPYRLWELNNAIKAIDEVQDRLADLEDQFGAKGFDTDLIALGNQLYYLGEKIRAYIQEEERT